MTAPAETIAGYGVRLDPLAEADLDMVLRWRNHPEVRVHMITDREISPDEHRRWYERTATSDDIACFVARWRDEPVAFLSLRSLDGGPVHSAESREPGVYLAPGSPLAGTLFALAPAVVLHDACFSEQPGGRLLATVKSTNERALRFNRQLGYVASEPGDDVVHDLVEMELTNDAHRAATEPLRRFLSRSSAPAATVTR